jgi:DNA (cytosine-5)-methyltransferase 1
LDDVTVPVIVENVNGYGVDALPLVWIRLHGAMFGLGVHRPRIFWANRLLLEPNRQRRHPRPLGVYGNHHDGRRLWRRADGTIQRAASTLREAQEAMGIDWMDWRELCEAIPPAYTEWIGEQLMQHLTISAVG